MTAPHESRQSRPSASGRQEPVASVSSSRMTISRLRRQIRILCGEGLGQLLFEQAAKVPKSPGFGLVSHR